MTRDEGRAAWFLSAFEVRADISSAKYNFAVERFKNGLGYRNETVL